MSFYLLVFLLMATAKESWAVCFQCSSSNFRCISSTQYRYCIFETNPVVDLTATMSCPSGQYCNTVGPTPCSNVVSPECICGFCGPSNYACISTTEIQLCTGGSPTSTIITCPSGTYCTFNSLCQAVGDSDCPAPAEAKCTTIGRFPTPSTNCKNYYMCVALNSTTLAKYDYSCVTPTLFNPLIQKCESTYTCPK